MNATKREAGKIWIVFLLVLYGGMKLSAQIPGNITLVDPKYLTGNTYAIVVGISDYMDDELDLTVAANDAWAVSSYLQKHGFPPIEENRIRVLVDHQATYENIVTALRWMPLLTTKDDRIIFFFSGHGAPHGLATADYNRTTGANILTHSTIKSLLKKSASSQMLMIVDACHAGGAESATYVGAVSDLLTGYANSGISMLLSSNIDQSSAEYPSTNLSYFTHYLLQGINGGYANKNKDNLITIGEAFEYVWLNVHVMTNEAQTPQKGGDFDPSIVMRLW